MNDHVAFIRDRMDITNLLHGYAHYADHGETEAFLGLFADDARVDIGNPDVTDKAGLRKLMTGREPAADGTQTRHLMSNLLFHSQGADQARGALYFTLMSTVEGALSLVLAGQYEFTVERRDDGWRIKDWKALMDGKSA